MVAEEVPYTPDHLEFVYSASAEQSHLSQQYHVIELSEGVQSMNEIICASTTYFSDLVVTVLSVTLVVCPVFWAVIILQALSCRGWLAYVSCHWLC